MAKKLLIGIPAVLILLLAGFAAVVAMQPDQFKITRTVKIAAPPDLVFDQVNDFHNWAGWSPWQKLDPNAKDTFSGPSAGKGAKFGWSGNDDIGEGHMTILESRRPELVSIDLTFVRPMQDSALTEFSFQPEGDQTVVTWTMAGEQNFTEKAVCMFMNMDQVVGGSFEEGLASIKQIAEAKAKEEQPDATSE
jgi:uncharacterized protein YndB with AHSA1/START domain